MNVLTPQESLQHNKTCLPEHNLALNSVVSVISLTHSKMHEGHPHSFLYRKE